MIDREWQLLHGKNWWGKCCFGLMQFGILGYVLLFPLGQAFREIFSIMSAAGVAGYYFSDYADSNLSGFRLKPLFFLFLGILIVKAFHSIDIAISLDALSSLSYDSLLLFFPAFEFVKDKRRLFVMAAVFTAVAVYLGLDSIYQYHYGHDLLRSMPKRGYLSATMKDPLLGSMVAIFIPITLSLFHLLPNFWNRVAKLSIYLLLTFPAYFFLLYSGRRIGWIAVAVIIILYIGALYGKLASAPILFGALVLPFSGIPRLSFAELFGDIRWKIWAVAFEVFQKNWLFGTGLNTFKQAQIKYGIAILRRKKYIECPHNIYLGLLIDAGIIGLLSFILLSAVYLLYAYDTCKKIKPASKELSHQIFCFILAYLAFLVVSLAGIDFYKTWMMGSPMIILGVTMGACVMARNH